MIATPKRFLEHKTVEETIRIVECLCAAPMKERSHGWDKYKGLSIGQAAKAQADETLAQTTDTCPAISLMSVVLAANRAYERQVKPHIDKLKAHETYRTLTLIALKKLLDQKDHIQFKTVWGHADKRKQTTLKQLVERFLALYPAALREDQHSVHEDRFQLNSWAKQSSLQSRKLDSIGQIKNVGVATYQHLRMTFGVDTVKPDQRVKEVLEFEFGEKLSDEGAIQAVERIAEITGRRVLEIDQIFVKYGSGYY